MGVRLTCTNISRITAFETAYNTDSSTFVESQITRAKKTLREYKNIVFTAIPIIIIASALIILFISSPIWRASAITTIAMMTVIWLIDGTAHARIEAYYEQLVLAGKQE